MVPQAALITQTKDNMNKLSSLKKAEILSIVYKHAFLKEAEGDYDELKQGAGYGAAIGGGIGGTIGTVAGLSSMSHAPTFDQNQIISEQLKNRPPSPNRKLTNLELDAIIQKNYANYQKAIGIGQTLNKQHGDPGSMRRLLTVMQQKGWLNTLGKAGKVGLLGAAVGGGLGAVAGAGIGAGVGAYRSAEQDTKKVPNKKRRA